MLLLLRDEVSRLDCAVCSSSPVTISRDNYWNDRVHRRVSHSVADRLLFRITDWCNSTVKRWFLLEWRKLNIYPLFWQSFHREWVMPGLSTHVCQSWNVHLARPLSRIPELRELPTRVLLLLIVLLRIKTHVLWLILNVWWLLISNLYGLRDLTVSYIASWLSFFFMLLCLKMLDQRWMLIVLVMLLCHVKSVLMTQRIEFVVAVQNVWYFIELYVHFSSIVMLALLNMASMCVQLVSILLIVNLRIEIRHGLSVVIRHLRSEAIWNYLLDGRHLWQTDIAWIDILVWS